MDNHRTTRVTRRPGPGGNTGGHLGGATVGGAALIVLTAATTVWIPIATTHAPGYTGGGIFAALFGLIGGDINWTTACTRVAAIELATLAVITTTVAWWWRRHRKNRTRIDAAGRKMATREDVTHLTPTGVTESARRLRPTLADTRHIDLDNAGVQICLTLDGTPLSQSWEDMAVDIWGPRTGKTTCRAIPAIVAAPGPVIVTSVKGDIVDATRDPRAERGPIWIFDPQSILDGNQTMWWNPLRHIDTITTARRLAEHFASAEREPGVQRDAFFDPSSEELVANLLLAAAVGGRTVLDAYRWVVNFRDDEPAQILRQHNYELPAEAINGVMNMPDRTKGGIYAGGQKMLMCLTEPAVTRWVTPPTTNTIHEFDPRAHVTTRGTLYLLSQGGPGSPAPLIAALTDATLRAGELHARTQPGRRLDPPMLSVLDEAANICRLRQLPSLYSYYGSHGLPIDTILQSYAQGIDVWGREGMRKLWSAANIRTYGGGVADPDFLDELSKLVGEHDIITRSTSTTGIGWGDTSVSHAPRRQRILDIADLHALPRGRMVVFSSGAPPVLGRTIPWHNGPHADRIKASIRHWDPDQQTDWTLQPAETPPDGTP